MRFTPKTQEEVAAEATKFGPLPRGTYDFEVASGEDTVSKAGNDMIVLDLLVYDSHGNRRKMKDWIVEAMHGKLKHLCEALGMHNAYQGGNLVSQDFVGRSGRVKVKIDGDYNKVDDYVPGIPNRQAATPKHIAPLRSGVRMGGPVGGDPTPLDDDIPF